MDENPLELTVQAKVELGRACGRGGRCLDRRKKPLAQTRLPRIVP